MSSVRALASQKLILYLNSLKAISIQNSQILIKNADLKLDELKYIHDLSGLYIISEKKLRTVFGDESLRMAFFNSMDAWSFYSFENDMVLKTPVGKDQVIWVFGGDGLSNLLAEKEGLGDSGEIYIVGNQDRIRSASRHIKDWKDTSVDNESIKQAKLKKIGVNRVKDYRGVEVVSAYSPFEYDRLNFILLSEMDKDEVLAPLKSLFVKIFFLCGVFCLLTILFAYLTTEKIVNLIDQMKDQINSLNLKFINTMEDEKKRMSYNLHDGVGQILTALKWGVSHKEDPEKLKDLCDDAFKEIRSISNNLMPAVLTEFGFFLAIKEYFSKLEGYYKIQATYWFSDTLREHAFKEGMDINLYRMIQELLHNTIKHGQAKSVSLVLIKEGEDLLLRYEDDGVGMLDSLPTPRVLLYRSELMGVTVKRSNLNPGLVYEMKIPLKRLFNEQV